MRLVYIEVVFCVSTALAIGAFAVFANSILGLPTRSHCRTVEGLLDVVAEVTHVLLQRTMNATIRAVRATYRASGCETVVLAKSLPPLVILGSAMGCISIWAFESIIAEKEGIRMRRLVDKKAKTH